MGHPTTPLILAECTQITLPNGTSYGMDYRFDHIYVGGYPPYYDTSTFQLSELTLPTGASLGFEYATPPMPYGYPPGTRTIGRTMSNMPSA